VHEPVNVWDYERLAAESLDAGVFGYFAGGAGDERTLRDNLEAYGRWHLRPRMLVDVAETTSATTVLGTPVSMPLLVAPFAMQGALHADGELGTARAAAGVGTIMCLSTLATAAPAEVAAATPGASHWFQVYVFRDRGVTQSLVDQAVEAGFSALVVTVDAPFLGRRERDLRTGFAFPAELTAPSVLAGGLASRAMTPVDLLSLIDPSLSWRDIEELASSSVPVVVKGVLTAEDARLACEHGAAGIVVSNHGGRQLDGVPATLDVLPEVVDAVAGRVEVLLDGGIRRGTDVVKALAHGAGAVLAGRAVAWGLTVDGEAGVRRVLELLREEIRLALALAGCPSPSAVTRAHVSPAPR